MYKDFETILDHPLKGPSNVDQDSYIGSSNKYREATSFFYSRYTQSGFLKKVIRKNEYESKSIIITSSIEQLIEVKAREEVVVKLPSKFKKIIEALERSKYILDLEQDFDEEESENYDFATWKRAIIMVSDCTFLLYKNTRKILIAPKIYHGPKGSVDVLWDISNYRFLINVPKDKTKPASFYGDNYGIDNIKGHLDTNKINDGLLFVLMNLANE